MKAAIADVYSGLDISVETFPADGEVNPLSYQEAINSFQPGDAVTIFTPDDTHFDIAMAAIERGLHVLVTKPAVKTLEHHRQLHEAAVRNNVLVAIEVHKRWDPIYGDARDKIKSLGGFSYLYSYMSQPKHQLETFKSWAGKSSDISYYLNSHHIDFHEWAVGYSSRPVRVTAVASTGVATGVFNMQCEDTITLAVQWENIEPESGDMRVTGTGTAVYTSSWIAPRSDVHSQQRFFYMGQVRSAHCCRCECSSVALIKCMLRLLMLFAHFFVFSVCIFCDVAMQKGEVNVDQAHRGYNMAADGSGYRSVNPLFMKYTPSDGKFAGQNGYGCRSFEVFIDAVAKLKTGCAAVADYDHSLASIATTYRTTAILEAGRMSLDQQRPVEIVYATTTDPAVACTPIELK